MTDALRPVAAGLLQLGAAIPSISIPPKRAAYGIAGTCSAAKTAALPAALDVNPLTADFSLLASAVHAHTLGRRVWTEMSRGGARVRVGGKDPLGGTQFYDFSNQRFEPLPAGAALRAGDALTTRCVYANTVAAGTAGGNAVARAGNPVRGCESTSCEMCFNFVVYAPKLPMTVSLGCESAAVPFCEDVEAGTPPSSSGLPSCAGFA